MQKDYNYLFKISIVGGRGSGKTCYFNRYIEDSFEPLDSSPSFEDNHTGSGLRRKTINFNDNCIIRLLLFDYNNNSIFRIDDEFYEEIQRSNGIILTYDICNRSSFNDCIRDYQIINPNGSDRYRIILVGTKLDIAEIDEKKRKVTYDEGKLFADQQGLEFYETSSKQNIGVHQSMLTLIGQILDGIENKYNDSNSNSNNNNNNNKSKCTIQ
ncbi:hypothetical protein DICPUDRAFT_80610 [Dictyostelium purpureum]|uniref:Uncharacterized protein n=1 Tax=Dictyostelium purpureum TaxID=5786 RepID=F0ZR02_DICPU|nr:uncharacterized protein DICPUDRAFT_80610 [Dictyostelium purpureum]EGC33622.1 hypothetical protein DICPUDRAFT_80610 [Dictyostelium purpureum]|eukprot:XP_003289842.1 hypothetical protein DICPUDRAFT_80610 [Dictyostelium purpureum]